MSYIPVRIFSSGGRRAEGTTDEQPSQKVDWRTHGVRIVKSSELDFNTPQTPGMTRAAAIDRARAGATSPEAARCAWSRTRRPGRTITDTSGVSSTWSRGARLEFMAEADPGDLSTFRWYVPHQEINARTEERLECVRSSRHSHYLTCPTPACRNGLSRVAKPPLTVPLVDLRRPYQGDHGVP